MTSGAFIIYRTRTVRTVGPPPPLPDSAIGSIISDSTPSDETTQTVTGFYGIDDNLLKSQKDIFTNFSSELEGS